MQNFTYIYFIRLLGIHNEKNITQYDLFFIRTTCNRF